MSRNEPTRSERIAERMTSIVGSIPFVLIQSCVLLAWVAVNSLGIVHYDPYPFILMNLALSLQAAYTGPFILISANRQVLYDRRINERDAAVNREAKRDIAEMKASIEAIQKAVLP